VVRLPPSTVPRVRGVTPLFLPAHVRSLRLSRQDLITRLKAMRYRTARGSLRRTSNPAGMRGALGCSRRMPTLLVALTLLAGAWASPAAPSEHRPSPSSPKRLARATREAILGLDPYLERIYKRASQLEEAEIDSHRSIGDLNGDDVTEIVIDHWTLTWDPTGTFFFLNGSYRAMILDGASGKKMFTHEAVFVDGFAAVVPFRVGQEGEPGLLAWESHGISSAYTVRYTGLTAQGESLWTRLLPSTWNWQTGNRWLLPAGGATDALMAADRIDVKPGRASDLLIGQSDYLLAPGTKPIARTTVSVLHGEDGSLTELPVSEMSTEAIPMVAGMPDLDHDQSDDFVLLGNADSDDGHISAFGARDGSAIWSTKYELRPWPWAEAIGDFRGSSTKDLMVEYDTRDTRVFAIVDGNTGKIAWSRKAIFPYVAGDIDKDGAPDIAGFYFIHGSIDKDVFVAFSNDGRKLYEVDYIPDTSECNKSFCFTFGFYLNAGDLNDDGVRDTYVEQQTSWDRDVISYIVTGRTGKMLYERRGLVPVKGAVDGRGDDLGVIGRRGKHRLSLSILNGSDLSEHWQLVIEGQAAKKFADGWAPYGAAVRLNSDRCADVLIAVKGAGAVILVALDGRDGSVLWQRAVTGGGRVTVDTTRSTLTSC
jgi:hypothetical protein